VSICRNCCFCSRVIVQLVVVSATAYVGKSTENFCRKKGSPIRKKHTHKPRVVCVCLIENRHKTIITQPIDRAAPSAVCPSPPSDIVCSISPFSLPPISSTPLPQSSPPRSRLRLNFISTQEKRKKKENSEKITEKVLNHKLGCSNFYSLRREEKEGYRSTSSSQTLTFQGVYIIISLLLLLSHCIGCAGNFYCACTTAANVG